MNRIIILIILFILSMSNVEGLKGAIHIHADMPGDDGSHSLDEIMKKYKSMGYDFIVYTPHHPIDGKGFTKNNMTVIYGYENIEDYYPYHVINIDGITILAHFGYQLYLSPELIYEMPKTDFIEVINQGKFCWMPWLKNTIPGEDTHQFENWMGKTWIELDCNNTINDVLVEMHNAADNGSIAWGYNRTVIIEIERQQWR